MLWWCQTVPMDNTLNWVIFASYAGFFWSLSTATVAHTRGQWEELKKYNAALIATTILCGAMILVGFFWSSSFDPSIPFLTGSLVGIVSGIFTAFGIMGGKAPGGPG